MKRARFISTCINFTLSSVLLGAILLLILSLVPPAAVCAEGSRSPLQQLIDDARNGDTLFVDRQTFDGNVVLNKPLAMIGNNGPVIRGEGVGSVVTIIADSCVIRGFSIERSGPMLVDEDAGILVRSNHNIVENNSLSDVLFGIYLYHAESNFINNNRIVGRKELDIGQRGSGIHIWNSSHNTFVGNTITDARDGFYIQNANNTHIEGNSVYSVRYGLHYMYADSNLFIGNSFSDNMAGAAIMYSRNILIRKNRFVHNRGFSSFGILFQDCHDSVIDSNIILDNTVGIFLEASTGNLLRRNVVARNTGALQVFQNSTGNRFTENAFIDNLTPLTIVGKRTESFWSVNGRGNYWSAYDGYDLDGDGIGDVPMKIQNIFEYLEGRHENLRMYLYSPASQALAAATTTFPIIDINQELDPHPLMRPIGVSFDQKHPRDLFPPSGWLAAPFAGICIAGLAMIRTLRRPKS
jgi:nitrous oxidase accessory protein